MRRLALVPIVIAMCFPVYTEPVPAMPVNQWARAQNPAAVGTLQSAWIQQDGSLQYLPAWSGASPVGIGEPSDLISSGSGSGGNEIVFASSRDGNVEIYAMNADGSIQTRLTSTPQITEHFPTYSPDGRWITFEVFAGDHVELDVMKADGSNRSTLSKIGAGRAA